MDKKKPALKREHELKIRNLERQVNEFKDSYLRALADFRNLQKRVIEERERERKALKKNIILKILPFLDNLDKAEEFIKDSGLKLIKEDFYKTLKKLEVSEIEVLGKKFDPNFSEVIQVVNGNEDGKVVKVVRKGYALSGEVIRPARVVVEKKAESKNKN